MAFRDDLGAAQARADALQKRVAELERENAALRGGDSPGEPAADDVAPADPDPRVNLGLMAVLPAIAIGLVAIGMHLPVLGVPALAIAALLFVRNGVLLEVADPDRLLVLSGRPRQLGDGKTVNYRVIGTGRAVRVPLLERANRLDMRPRALTLTITGAYLDTGDPVTVELSATIRLTGTEPRVHAAIERFMGQPASAIDDVARQTLESSARSFLANLRRDDLQPGQDKLARAILSDVEQELADRGIEIDSLDVTPVGSST